MQELSAGFPRNVSLEIFRPPTVAVFSITVQVKGIPIRDAGQKDEMLLWHLFCLTDALSHYHQRQQSGNWAQAMEGMCGAGVIIRELKLKVTGWWWPLCSNYIWIIAMIWCRSLSYLCLLACGRKTELFSASDWITSLVALEGMLEILLLKSRDQRIISVSTRNNKKKVMFQPLQLQIKLNIDRVRSEDSQSRQIKGIINVCPLLKQRNVTADF